MKVFAENRGDPTVGIWSTTVELKFDIEIMDDAPEIREFIRSKFAALASEMTDGPVWVWFEDECPDCIVKYVGEYNIDNRICKNRDCPSYHPVDI